MIEILTPLNLNNHNKKYGSITLKTVPGEKKRVNALKLPHTVYSQLQPGLYSSLQCHWFPTTPPADILSRKL